METEQGISSNRSDRGLEVWAAEKYQSIAELTKKAQIAEKFGLSGTQMAIFNHAFSYYLEAKLNKDLYDIISLPETEMKVKHPIFGLLPRFYNWVYEENENLIKKLKENLERTKKAITYEGKPTVTQLTNTANYLTSKYLLNPKEFDLQIRINEVHIKKLLGK